MAVGTVSESIEIFDLDVMDALEPVAVLGGRNASQSQIAKDGMGMPDIPYSGVFLKCKVFFCVFNFNMTFIVIFDAAMHV